MNLDSAKDMLDEYVLSTRNEKYVVNGTEVMELIYHLGLDKFASLYAAFKYLCRYSAHSGEKTGNIKDLLKAAHYVMIEMQEIESNFPTTFTMDKQYPPEVICPNGTPIWIDKNLKGTLDLAVRHFLIFVKNPKNIGPLQQAKDSIIEEIANHISTQGAPVCQ